MKKVLYIDGDRLSCSKVNMNVYKYTQYQNCSGQFGTPLLVWSYFHQSL